MSETEVFSDGKTVWVNGSDGMCLGRFSDAGVDVHRTYAEQAAGMPQCLDCCHDLPFAEAWERFKDSMIKHYGVIVEESHRPTIDRWGKRIQEPAPCPTPSSSTLTPPPRNLRPPGPHGTSGTRGRSDRVQGLPRLSPPPLRRGPR